MIDLARRNAAGVFLLLALTGCRHPAHEERPALPSALDLAYATGFRTSPYQGSTLLEVRYPYQGATTGLRYLLVHRGDSIPPHDQDIEVIRVPVRRIVCTSTTQIPMLDALGVTPSLVGFPTTSYISSPIARRLIDEGKVAELGVDKAMDLEKLKALSPDMVMSYSINGDLSQFRKIVSMGIPVVINGEYLENHPLGRAEWIKFMALFFDREHRADSVFRAIASRYDSVKALAVAASGRPTVLSGIVYGDAWFLPGGKNNAATLYRDAGCAYLWAADSSHGFLALSPEAVYARARDADLWIGVGSYHSLTEMGNAYPMYRRFEAFREGHVYTYDALQGATGGSEYLELGYLRPDLVLKDLVKIAHPNLLPGDTLYFHAQLKTVVRP